MPCLSILYTKIENMQTEQLGHKSKCKAVLLGLVVSAKKLWYYVKRNSYHVQYVSSHVRNLKIRTYFLCHYWSSAVQKEQLEQMKLLSIAQNF